MKAYVAAAAVLLLTAGCATGTWEAPVSSDAPTVVLGAQVACAPSTPTGALLNAGGGRPGTGYLGVAVAARMPSASELANGWSADINYAQTFPVAFALEFSLGILGHDIERNGDEGDLRSTSLGIACQFGRPFGSSRWFAGAGVAYLLNDLSGMSGSVADDSVAGMLCVGVEIPLHARGSVSIDLRYDSSMIPVTVGDDIDLSSFSTRVNYVFLY